MKVIIQCAASKQPDAGKLRTQSGGKVVFVATLPTSESDHPSGARYVRPDDPCGKLDMTWRERLTRYNEEGGNPCDLKCAAELYRPKVYKLLTNIFRPENVFILSAGWGLIRANFWTPDYNITFSKQSKKKKLTLKFWRDFKATTDWPDFNHLKGAQSAQDEPIHFFGGKDYLPLFYKLVTSVPAKMFVHHKGEIVHHKGKEKFEYVEYVGKRKTNWHYSAAEQFAAKWASEANPKHSFEQVRE